MDEEMRRWVESHFHEDPLRLRLKYGSDERLSYAIMQIECRRKTSTKLRDTLRNPSFVFPTALSAEQSTSDRLAQFHASLISEGDTVLDMTCGLGIDAFHIASRASAVDAIDIVPEVVEAARKNAVSLGINNFKVCCCDSVTALQDIPEKSYDTVFIDPARRDSAGKRLYALSECQPDIVAILPELERISDRLIIKASPMLDITQVLRELPQASEVYSVGTATECKELVIVVNFRVAVENTINRAVKVKAVTLLSDNSCSEWKYVIGQDKSNAEEKDRLDRSILCRGVLYEPFPAVMKVGELNRLEKDFPRIKKLNHDTHLFFSTSLVAGFPGRPYEITEIIDFSSSEIKKLAGRRLKINVTTRNFPIAAPALVKKLHITEGGVSRLFAALLPDGPVIILTRPIGDNE